MADDEERHAGHKDPHYDTAVHGNGDILLFRRDVPRTRGRKSRMSPFPRSTACFFSSGDRTTLAAGALYKRRV